jgi:hypothetical protein
MLTVGGSGIVPELISGVGTSGIPRDSVPKYPNCVGATQLDAMVEG